MMLHTFHLPAYLTTLIQSLVVVGGDADLVLQGLALPNLPDFNVYIPDVKRQGNVVSLR